MKKANPLAQFSALVATTAGLLAFLPAPANAATSTYYMRAQIIPAQYAAVGTALTGGENGTKNGFGLVANGINSNWGTSASGTIHFIVFTFSSRAETGTVSFKVVGPSGGTVYSYSFGREQVPAGPNWYAISAQGNYAAPGLYFAEFYFGSSMIGWAPLNLNS